jgi:hypothetical protein
METYTELSQDIKTHLEDPHALKSGERVVERGLQSLPVLGEFLHRDLPIEQTERLEALLKAILRTAMSRPMSGRDARRIAQFQKELGFILKYKSYAIKAATPVGYSIFLQNEHEGFSFQRHVVHKLEVFHILSVKPGGYIFLCDFGDWTRIYERESFERWFNGEPNAGYERYRFVPEPGDVFIISELGVVHTVIGCVLEEYATVSTDMVDRLHDQNRGKKIPAGFDRAHADPVLRAIEPPSNNRLVTGLGEKTFERIPAARIQGGERTLLCDSFVTAAGYIIEPGKEAALTHDDRRAVLLRMNSGSGTIVIADSSECAATLPCLPFQAGDLFLLAPGMRYAVRNEGSGHVAYSEHCIAPDVAFI